VELSSCVPRQSPSVMVCSMARPRRWQRRTAGHPRAAEPVPGVPRGSVPARQPGVRDLAGHQVPWFGELGQRGYLVPRCTGQDPAGVRRGGAVARPDLPCGDHPDARCGQRLGPAAGSPGRGRPVQHRGLARRAGAQAAGAEGAAGTAGAVRQCPPQRRYRDVQPGPGRVPRRLAGRGRGLVRRITRPGPARGDEAAYSLCADRPGPGRPRSAPGCPGRTRRLRSRCGRAPARRHARSRSTPAPRASCSQPAPVMRSGAASTDAGPARTAASSPT
jgi:hypothetical protein